MSSAFTDIRPALKQAQTWLSEHGAFLNSVKFKDCRHIEGIAPGIMGAVQILMDHGIETTESCEGGEGHAFPDPTVVFSAGDAGAGFHALGLALTYGLPVSTLSVFWYMLDGKPYGPQWKMTFSKTVPLRD